MATINAIYVRLAHAVLSAGHNVAHEVTFLSSPKRVRAVIDGTVVLDSQCAGLLLESGSRPFYYFPRADFRAEGLERSAHRTRCPHKGEASYWNLRLANRRIENALWGYEAPPGALAPMATYLALAADKVDHWYEEDEEIFGHPRDPYHRIDLRARARRVRVAYAGTIVAETRRALFLFETGLPTRYYIPRDDVRPEFLEPSDSHSVCPYKGRASYWSLRVGERFVRDAVWSYPDPLPELPRIKAYLCFYPERVERIEIDDVSGPPPSGA